MTVSSRPLGHDFRPPNRRHCSSNGQLYPDEHGVSNRGVPRNSAAMISTDSGAWVIGDSQKGKLFLKATIRGATSEPWFKTWYGMG